jgi:hypothetical protein
MCRFKQSLKKGARILAVLGVVSVMIWLLDSAQAQMRRRRGRMPMGYDPVGAEVQRINEALTKAIDPAFSEDVFTFGRLKFDSEGDGWARAWDDDTPLADLNVTYRLYECTSLKVRPGLHAVDITTKDLADYPFVYMAGAGRATFSDAEAAALRDYMLKGGFMMVDDFWGDEQWEHFMGQFKMIFPNRKPEELTLDHPIFHNVYKFKKQPQIPSVGDYLGYGTSYDVRYDYNHESHDPHYYGVYDDRHRMVMLICHNNHYGDGWEHEGHNEDYFDVFSMPMGYPMLINIVNYAMTH